MDNPSRCVVQSPLISKDVVRDRISEQERLNEIDGPKKAQSDYLINRAKFKRNQKLNKVQRKVKQRARKMKKDKTEGFKTNKQQFNSKNTRQEDGQAEANKVEEQKQAEYYVQIPTGLKIMIPLDGDRDLNEEFFIKLVTGLCQNDQLPLVIKLRGDLSLLLINRDTGELRIGPQINVLSDTWVCLAHRAELESLVFRLTEGNIIEKVYDYDTGSKDWEVAKISAFIWICDDAMFRLKNSTAFD